MAEDFSQYPISIAEARAERSRSGAAWTPRDALIAALRDIDSGAVNPKELTISYVEERDNGRSLFSYYRATGSIASCIGLMETVKLEMLLAGRDA